jgi:hypothetical protein
LNATGYIRYSVCKKQAAGFLLDSTGFRFAVERSFGNQFITVAFLMDIDEHDHMDTF